ncbi:MAG: thiol-disulfide oxidoreductase DCC family protein, partial [Terriglobia bacterium]
MADIREPKPGQSERYVVLYDGQCEICQACISWLTALDGRKKTSPVPISAEAIATLDTRLTLEACLQQLHVLTPGRELLVGWDAVACLARLFPATWLIGILGSIFPFRTLGRLLYGFVAANRYSLSKCRGGA